jgi:putative oxidoreductase
MHPMPGAFILVPEFAQSSAVETGAAWGAPHQQQQRVAVVDHHHLLSRYSPAVRSVLRIVVALLFFEHGLSKLFGFPQGHIVEAFTLAWYAGVIEFAGGALLALGLFTRLAAFIMSGEMAFAYFLSHAPHSFFPIINRGDGAILYCFIFLYFIFAGGGPWSLDAVLRPSRHQRLKPAE